MYPWPRLPPEVFPSFYPPPGLTAPWTTGQWRNGSIGDLDRGQDRAFTSWNKTQKPNAEKPGIEEKRDKRGSGHTAEEKCRAAFSARTERRKPGASLPGAGSGVEYAPSELTNKLSGERPAP
jgi:hypothetical protein